MRGERVSVTRDTTSRIRDSRGQPVPGTGDQVEELWDREEEVEDLRKEEEEHRLAEVTDDPDDGKRHASEVAVRVSHEDRSGEPVEGEKGDRDSQEGHQQVGGEEVRAPAVTRQLDPIEDEERDGDQDGLTDLQAVHASQDVDGIRAEDTQQRHVPVVQGTQVYQGGSQQGTQRPGDHDGRHVVLHDVDHEEGDAGDGREEELVPPAQVEDVVHEAKEEHATDGEESRRQSREGAVLEGSRLRQADQGACRLPVVQEGDRHEQEQADQEDSAGDHSCRLWTAGHESRGQVSQAAEEQEARDKDSHGLAVPLRLIHADQVRADKHVPEARDYLLGDPVGGRREDE